MGMSTAVATPERSSRGIPPPAAPSSQRVLACVLCQQRKIKCDREFPCANCVRAQTQCVPAARLTTRPRRRRFPERALLERIRRYEGLLHRNNVEFEPLHPEAPAKAAASPSADSDEHDSDEAHSARRAPRVDRHAVTTASARPETVYEAKSLWHAMNQRPRNADSDDSDSSPDEVRETVLQMAWGQVQKNKDHFLFGSRKTNLDLSALHPPQAHLFRLWQIYLDNVNPLLKVTHSGLQKRIVDGASDLENISPPLEALMFSIYCVAVLSLFEDDCRTLFGSSRQDLLTSFQFGCQQALLDCEVLRTSDRECLTALLLYLVSVRPETDPQSLSSMLGVAVRIAQRMGIHNESTYAKCTALESELRRRLWWALVLFDTRICEMSGYKTVTLAPSWDCRILLNLNDFDLREDMDAPSEVRGASEALFAVVRSELGDFVRHSGFHLDFTNPALKPVAKHVHQNTLTGGSQVVTIEKMIEDKYLRHCKSQNPLHFVTIWTARGQLAKARLLEHYSRFSRLSTPAIQQTEAQRDTAVSHAMTMLDCDTKVMTEPTTKGFLWLVCVYFPFPAYIHITQDMRRRPTGKFARKTWEAMSDNYEARFVDLRPDHIPFFKGFAKMIFQAWEACQNGFIKPEQPPEEPRIVSGIKQKLKEMTACKEGSNMAPFNCAGAVALDDPSVNMPTHFGGPTLHDILGFEDSHDIPGQFTMDMDVNQLDWAAMDWDPKLGGGW